MSGLQTLAARLGFGPRQSIVVQPFDATSFEDAFVLDRCATQGAAWPASVSRFAVADRDVSDHVRFGPKGLTVRGEIANSPVTFWPGGGIVNSIAAVAAGPAVSGLPAGGLPVIPDRAPQLLGKLLELRDTKRLMLVQLSWTQFESMVIAEITSDHDEESGDTIPVTIRFEQMRLALAGLTSVLPDTQSLEAGAAGTTDNGDQAMLSEPQTPIPDHAPSVDELAMTPPVR